MPNTPVRDLQIHKTEKDLVIATHGRSFWIMDDITPLYEIADKKLADAKIHLFAPRHAYRMQGGQSNNPNQGTNAPNGVLFKYYLSEKPTKELKLTILTAEKDTIISYSSTKNRKGEPIKVSKDFFEDPKQKRPEYLTIDKGMNGFNWDMRYPDAEQVDGTNVMWAGSVTGPKAIPGKYKAKLSLGDSLITEIDFEIRKDPRLETSDADYKEQFALLLKINKKVSETHKTINQLRQIRNQVNGYLGAVKDTALLGKFNKIAKPMLKQLDEVEAMLMQPKAKAPQDVLAHPVMYNDRLAGVGSVVESADTKPTKASYEVVEDLGNKIDGQINKVKTIIEKDIPAFNNLVNQQKIPAINLSPKKDKDGASL